MFQYVSIALVAITALFVLINLLKGVLRGLKKTVGTLVAIVVSAILSAVVTFTLCTPSSSVMQQLMGLVSDLLPPGEIQDILGIDAIGEALSYYISMLLAPIVFVVVYILLSMIVSIVVGIAVKRILPNKKPSAVVHRLGGLGVGLVCGILVSAILLMPIVGMLQIAVDVGGSDAIDLGDDTVSEIFEDASEDQIFAIYSFSCGWMYNSMASARFDGEKVYLKDDIGVILDVVGNISSLAGEVDGFGEGQVDSIDGVVDSLDNSALLKHTIAGVLSEMAAKWVAGESFIGMEKIDAGELLNPVIDTMLEVISTSNKDNIVADMRTLTGILDVFVKHDMLSYTDDYRTLLSKLGNEGVIPELMRIANSNERMSVLSDEINKLSIRALASTIGIPKDRDERYELVMDEVADVLNESRTMGEAERFDFCKDGFFDAFDKYGVEIEGLALDHVTESIIYDLGAKSTVKGKDVSEFFVVYAIASEDADVSAGYNGFDSLANEQRIVVNPDGTISVGGKVLENYNATNYGDSAAYKMGKQHVDFGDAASLYSADSMRSTLVTLEDILANVKKYSDCSDPEAEAEKISEILTCAINVFGESEGEVDKTHILDNVGELLDMMSHTETFGEGATEDILKAIFQSDSVKGELGLTSKEVNTFADKLNETANSEEGSYKTTTQAVSSTVTVVDKVKDDKTTKEERREATEQLISDMTPQNAELLSTMTTPSMMEKYGATQEKSSTVASSITTMFNNMANYSSTSSAQAGDEEYAREADAVNTMLTLAMDSADSDESSLFVNAEGDGRTNVTAAEYVELLVGSEVVSQTLLTTVYEEGNDEDPFGVDPSAEDMVALTEAMNNYYAEHSQGLSEEEHELLILKLNAVAIITDVECPFER